MDSTPMQPPLFVNRTTIIRSYTAQHTAQRSTIATEAKCCNFVNTESRSKPGFAPAYYLSAGDFSHTKPHQDALTAKVTAAAPFCPSTARV
jgi:hypothetical protein